MKDAPLMQAWALNWKHKNRLLKFARNKHSSLLRIFVNYGWKKFYNIAALIINYDIKKLYNFGPGLSN